MKTDVDTKKTIPNETKVAFIKSLRESWIWKKIVVGIMNHWGKSDGNQEYQDSNDSASTCDSEIQHIYSRPFLRLKWRQALLHFFFWAINSSATHLRLLQLTTLTASPPFLSTSLTKQSQNPSVLAFTKQSKNPSVLFCIAGLGSFALACL